MTPVKEVALEHDLPVFQPEKLSGSQEMADLMDLGADGIVTAHLDNSYRLNYWTQLPLQSMFMLLFFLNTVVVPYPLRFD